MTSLPKRKPGRLRAKRRSGNRSGGRKRRPWGYLVMWEFHIRAGMERRFEKVYGAQGDWARLFSQDASFIGTELMHNLIEGMYVTLDFWISPEAYDEFRNQHVANYNALDRKCQSLIESEREIGRFVRVSNPKGSG